MSVEAQIKPKSQVERKERRPIESVVTAFVFVATIFGFGILTAQRFSIPAGTVAVQEHRVLSACPHLRFSYDLMRAFPSGFDTFYKDRFAYRTDLVGTVAWLKYSYFDVSTTGKVLAGRNGWLYFMDGGDEETLRRTPLFTDKDLADWTCMLEERRAWCADRHIKFLFVISPSKSSIYREFVPPEYTALDDKTRADQLLDYLKAHSTVETLDLRKSVSAAKSLGEIYFKTDTHWNRLGGFVGYRAIMARLQPWFPHLKPLELKDMQMKPNVFYPGDLASMMGLEHRIFDWYTEIKPKKGFTWKVATPPAIHDIDDPTLIYEPFATETKLMDAPKAFFIRDSFFVMPQEFISESFKRAYLYWKPFYDFPAQAIENDKPDVLVQEMIERHLCRPAPQNPPELAVPVPSRKAVLAKHRSREGSKIAVSPRQLIR
jgi:hypothetical protein